MVVVTMLEKGSVKKIDGYSLIKEIHKLMEWHEKVIVNHTYRDANKCVDVLAKKDINGERGQYFLEEIVRTMNHKICEQWWG